MADFEQVTEERTPRVVNHPRNKDGESEVAKQFLNLLLGTLSQRTVAVFSALFTICGLGSCFWLWFTILAKSTPSLLQIGGATIYSGFLLALEVVRRRAS